MNLPGDNKGNPAEVVKNLEKLQGTMREYRDCAAPQDRARWNGKLEILPSAIERWKRRVNQPSQG